MLAPPSVSGVEQSAGRLLGFSRAKGRAGLGVAGDLLCSGSQTHSPGWPGGNACWRGRLQQLGTKAEAGPEGIAPGSVATACVFSSQGAEARCWQGLLAVSG